MIEVYKQQSEKVHQASKVKKMIPGWLRVFFEVVGVPAFIVCAALIVLDQLLYFITFPSYLNGIAAISFGIILLFLSLEGYVAHYTAGDITKNEVVVSEDVAAAFTLFPQNMLYGFFATQTGKNILYRLGIDPSEFLSIAGNNPVSYSQLLLEGGFLDSTTLSQLLYSSSDAFQRFLQSKAIQKEHLLGCAQWMDEIHKELLVKHMWWRKESVAKIEGIGYALVYGQGLKLKQYSEEIRPRDDASLLHNDALLHDVEQIETILSKSENSHALIVSENGSNSESILRALLYHVHSGKVSSFLSHYHMRRFDYAGFFSSCSRETVEQETRSLFSDIALSGNVVFVIDNFASFLSMCTSHGIDFFALLDTYLQRSEFRIIATSDQTAFHSTLERDMYTLSRFGVVQASHINTEGALRVLEDTLGNIEAGSNVFFTYQALAAVSDSAQRYITIGHMPEKAINLLSEVATYSSASGIRLVMPAQVLNYVEHKTGMKLSQSSESDRHMLLNLEDELHKKVIGQHEAIVSVSNALRRVRAGISNPKRPFGSFLFLGPTGVGKTETAKALSSVIYGSSTAMIRFDMSEFSGVDAVDKLIGSHMTGSAGLLSSALREAPSGVLLLDEFEKASRAVADLFLQILDEGVFSDMRGEEVNVRNYIIIATSNAGADILMQKVESGISQSDFQAIKPEIIDHIVGTGLMRPEFINRFDGIVLFDLLSEKDLAQIGLLALSELSKRIHEKGYTLSVEPSVLSQIILKAYDPRFGARNLRRAMQDTIESAVAKKLLQESVIPGSIIYITSSDIM